MEIENKTACLIPLSQNNPLWKDMLIDSAHSMGNWGCLITCIAIMAGRRPDEVLRRLKQNGGLQFGNEVIHAVAARLYGLRFLGKAKADIAKPDYPTIMETDHFKGRGFPQHFCVWLGLDKIIDPWDGKIKDNKFKITGWRLYKRS